MPKGWMRALVIAYLWITPQAGFAGAQPGIAPSLGIADWQGKALAVTEVFRADAESGDFVGEPKDDPLAHGGKSVFFAVSKAYHPNTGASWKTPILDPGSYRAVFRLKGRGKSDDGLAGSLIVETVNSPPAELNQRLIHEFHQLSTSDYFNLAVPFTVNATAPVSLGVKHNGQTDLWADDVVLYRLTYTPGGKAKVEGKPRTPESPEGAWEFRPEFGDLMYPPESEGTWSPIRVPSAWNANGFAKLSGDTAKYYPEYPDDWDEAEAGWYRLRFRFDYGDPPEGSDQTLRTILSPKGKRIFFLFDAAAYSAEVYLNGVAVAYHKGSFTPFEADLTDYLLSGEENVLLVGVRTWVHYHDWKKRRNSPIGSFWGNTSGGSGKTCTSRSETRYSSTR